MGASSEVEGAITGASRGSAPGGGAPPLRLSLPARPESVSAVRRAIARMGEQLGYGRRRVEDLMTVVSEACMNAAVHAYDGGDGDFEVSAEPGEAGIRITVVDHGGGIRPRPAFDSPSARLGLLVIATLSSSVEISTRRGAGTRVRVDFDPARLN